MSLERDGREKSAEGGEDAAVLQPLRARIRVLRRDGGDELVFEVGARAAKGFGVVVTERRHLLAVELARVAGAGLLADLAGIIAAVIICRAVLG